MLSRFPLRLAGRLWAVLLVLTIAVHAGAPIAAPLEVRSGSAFSADTVDVAVAPTRRVVAVATAEQLAPPLLSPAEPERAPAPLTFAIPPAHRWPDPTGPPAASAPIARHLAPRGPPFT